MMIRFKTPAALFAFSFVFVLTAIAQLQSQSQAQESKSKLPFELQVVLSEYHKQRAEGLTRLYRQSIEALRKAQAPFLRDGKLEESTAIESKIKELEKKITTLAAGKNSPGAAKSPQESGGSR